MPDARKIFFGYDLRERLTSTTYGDGSPAIANTYTPDGLLASTATSGGGRAPIRWTYGYNNRRVLVLEGNEWGLPNVRWDFVWSIDAHGHVAGLTDPWGWIGYAPNALGQPTQVGYYANGVRYHPTGAVAAYTLTNGVPYTMQPNLRGMPATWQHGSLVNDSYTYDATGNVTAIQDLRAGLHRTMGYDALDRLTTANGPWGAGTYQYDPIDNLVASSVGSRTLVHHIDRSTNRLTALSGTLNLPIAYDANGNVASRGAQNFVFDIGNRLREATAKATYTYDGHGRRTIVADAVGQRLQFYTREGRLRFSARPDTGSTRHVYLGSQLIAEHAHDNTIRYVHTDALGSPVVRSDASGQEAASSRTRYEPYGSTVAGSTNPTGIGFTGHVNDSDTGLVYMQQRYYDPLAGRFLSVDPVVTDDDNGAYFNRYEYAESNPYKYVDPDGRRAICTGSGIAASCGKDGEGVAGAASGTAYGLAVGGDRKTAGGVAGPGIQPSSREGLQNPCFRDRRDEPYRLIPG